jgi:hypothetical protein
MVRWFGWRRSEVPGGLPGAGLGASAAAARAPGAAQNDARCAMRPRGVPLAAAAPAPRGPT